MSFLDYKVTVVPMMKNRHQILVLLSCCVVALVKGWGNNEQLFDRRSLIGAASANLFVFAGIPKNSADAVLVEESSPSSSVVASQTFSAYNVIPDSVNLDPRLEAVNPVTFLKNLALSSNKAGGSIWLGEHHNSERDHQFQAKVIQSVHTERMKKKIKSPEIILTKKKIEFVIHRSF